MRIDSARCRIDSQYFGALLDERTRYSLTYAGSGIGHHRFQTKHAHYIGHAISLSRRTIA